MTLGERLLQLRKNNGLSQDSLAKMLYVTRQSISLWENDKAMPSIDLLKRLSSIYNISVDDLLGAEPIEPSPIAKANIVKDKKTVISVFKYDRCVSQTVFFSLMLGLIAIFAFNMTSVDGTILSLIYILPFFIIWLVNKLKTNRNVKHYLLQDKNGYILFYSHHLCIVTDTEKRPQSIAYTSFKRTTETDEYLLFQFPNGTVYCVDKNDCEGYIENVIDILSKNNTHKNKSACSRAVSKGSTKKFMLIKNISTMLFVLSFFTLNFGLLLFAFINKGYCFAFSIIIPLVGLIYGIVLKIKQYRGKKLIITSAIMLSLAIIYSIFFAIPNPIGVEQNTIPIQEQYLNSYSAVFRNNGYTVVAHEELPEFKGVTDFRTAASSDGSYIVEFYAFETNLYAKSYYDNIYENLDGNGYAEKSYELGTTAMRSVTTSEDYFYIYVNNLAAIKVHTDIENKEEIETMLQKIGAEH